MPERIDGAGSVAPQTQDSHPDTETQASTPVQQHDGQVQATHTVQSGDSQGIGRTSNLRCQICRHPRQVSSDAFEQRLEAQTMRIVESAIGSQRNHAARHRLDAPPEKINIRYGIEDLRYFIVCQSG